MPEEERREERREGEGEGRSRRERRREKRRLRAEDKPRKGFTQPKGQVEKPDQPANADRQARFKKMEGELKEKKLSPVSPDKFNNKQGNQLLSRVTKRLEKFKAKHPGASEEKMQRKAAKFAKGASYRMGVRSALRNAASPDKAREGGMQGLGDRPRPPRDRY